MRKTSGWSRLRKLHTKKKEPTPVDPPTPRDISNGSSVPSALADAQWECAKPHKPDESDDNYGVLMTEKSLGASERPGQRSPLRIAEYESPLKRPPPPARSPSSLVTFPGELDLPPVLSSPMRLAPIETRSGVAPPPGKYAIFKS